jgi:hypothetical protein
LSEAGPVWRRAASSLASPLSTGAGTRLPACVQPTVTFPLPFYAFSNYIRREPGLMTTANQLLSQVEGVIAKMFHSIAI